MAFLDTVTDCIDATRKVLSAARASVELTAKKLPEKPLRVASLSALVSSVVLVADRWLLMPYSLEGDYTKAAVIAVVSILVLCTSFAFSLFVAIVVPLVLKDGEAAAKTADAWSTMFCFVWFLTVIVFLCDLLVKSSTNSLTGPIFYIFSLLGDARHIFSLKANLLFPYIAYSVIAYLVLLARSFIIERRQLSTWSIIGSSITLIPTCALMLYVAMSIDLKPA
jgi:hypothetical protein